MKTRGWRHPRRVPAAPITMVRSRVVLLLLIEMDVQIAIFLISSVRFFHRGCQPPILLRSLELPELRKRRGPGADTENQTPSFLCRELPGVARSLDWRNSPAGDTSYSFRSLLQLDVNKNHTSTPSPSTAIDVALSCPRPSQSKADGAVLQCPLTTAMYKDPNLLRKHTRTCWASCVWLRLV